MRKVFTCLLYGGLLTGAAHGQEQTQAQADAQMQQQLEQRLRDAPEHISIAEPSERFPAAWYAKTQSDAGDGVANVVPAPVRDKPFSARQEVFEPSAGGQLSRHRVTGFEARDRDGRRRDESESGQMGIDEQDVSIKTVMVTDPISHCQFHWTEAVTGVNLPAENRMAIVSCGPRTLRYKDLNIMGAVLGSAPTGTTTTPNGKTTTEHLPIMELDGVRIDRLRVTNRDVDEHGQPRERIVETWYSPDLEEIVRTSEGRETYSGMANIHRGDPDPKLFYPPEGYRIQVQPAR